MIAKRIETLEQKYGSGVTNVFQTKEVKDKMIATYQQKYGANSHMSSDIGYSNYKKKLEEKFGLGITNVFQIKFLCLLGNKKEYTKAAITRWYPEFKQYY